MPTRKKSNTRVKARTERKVLHTCARDLSSCRCLRARVPAALLLPSKNFVESLLTAAMQLRNCE